MATYGEAGKNPYTLAGVGGILSNVVNAETGVTDVYRQGAANTYTPIATYNPSTGAITPYSSANLSSSEIQTLSSNKTNIKNASVSTATSAGLDSTKANQLLSPNVATAPATTQGTTAGATSPTAAAGTSTDPFKYDVNKDSIGERKNNYPETSLVYPLNRKGNRGGDYIQFEILEYKKSGLESPTNAAGKVASVALVGMENRKSKTLATICLPIQSGIIDSMSVDWGGGELNPITAAFANVAYSQISSAGSGDVGGYFKTLGANIRGIGAKFSSASPELRKLLINHFVQEAVGTPGLLSRTIGGALNNNLELLFNGPMLRSFTFNFKLTPRESKESQLIKSIIRYFKMSMVPSLSQSQLFLLAPNIFKIKYIYTGKGDQFKPHPYLNKIKVAALRDFSVNYSPDGNYMTYGEDGSMTQYDLSMTFGEIDPIYEQDYNTEEGLTGMGW